MPRLLTLRIAALERIAHELRFAPPGAARRHTARAEKLAALIDPGTVYPEDFVVFQITGFRPDIERPELIPGDALHRDLAALLDRLSRRAAFRPEELRPPQWLSTSDLLKRWGVSRKTVERLRTRGLIGRRVALPRGRAMNVFAEAVVRAVEGRGGVRPGGAPALRRRPERKPGGPPTRAVTPRDRRLVERAMRTGVRSAAIAERIGKSRATVFRSRARQLADRCRSVRLAVPGGVGAVIQRERDGERFLTDGSITGGLGAPGAAGLAEHVADALRAGRPDPLAERARAFAYWTLVVRAQAASRGLDRTRPAALAIDRIVTDLRWAAALKAELVRAEQLLLLRTVEVQVGAGLLDLPGPGAVELLRRCLGALSAAVDRFDPTAGRLAGVASMDLSRAVTRWQGEQPGPHAARARVPGPGMLGDWTRTVAVWQAWTNPPAGLRERLSSLPAEDARLLMLRYGWDGGPPRDAVELGAALKKPARIVVRMLNAAERRALKPAPRRRRGKGSPP